ncbi:tape measure protein [Timonella sp. A28]|uniref:tape measure protein n=1 Tax=Timonella sp. A28 TaxID=3442640 RepID=UPI003EB99FBB
MPLKVGELYATLKLEDRDFNQALTRSGRSFSALRNTLSAGLQVAAGAFATTTLATAALGAAAVKVGYDYNRMQQSSRAALTTLLGSAEAANAQMDKLDAFAKNSPFAKQVFIQAQQQLLGFGMTAEDVIPTLDAIQNAVAAVGGGNQQVSEVTYALAQMQGQGKLTGETLNQLGQYGIDAATILGKEWGKTGAEIRDMASRPGGIPADQVFAPLTEGLMKRFGGATDNIKQQMDGAADRVKGAFRDIGSALAKPFVDPKGGGMAVEWTNKLADTMRAAETKIRPLVDILQNRYRPALDKITPALDKARGAINSWDLSKVNAQLDELSGYTPLIAGAATALFALGTGSIPGLSALGLTLNPVVAGLAAVAVTSPEVRDAFASVMATLEPLLPVLHDAGVTLADVLMDALVTLAPAIGELAVGFSTAGVSLAQSFIPALTNVLVAATPLVEVVAGLASFVGELPGPVLAAGAAMLLFRSHIVTLSTGLGELGQKFQQTEMMRAWNAGLSASSTALIGVSSAAASARSGIQKLGGAMLGAFGGPVGLAITGISAALGAFMASQAQAQAQSQEFRATLDQTTGAITEQTRALMFDELRGHTYYDELMSVADALGLSMRDLVSMSLGEVTPAIERMNGRFAEYRDELDAVSNSYERSLPKYEAMRHQLELEDRLRMYLGGTIKQNSEDLEYNREKIEAVKGSQDGAAGATRSHTDAVKEQIDAQREAADANLSQAEATLRAKEAQDRASDAVSKYKKLAKEGTATDKELTAAKREAESAVLSSVRSFKSHTDAMRRNNASAEDLDAVIGAQREEFIKQRRALGDSKKAANELADSYGLIPNNVKTKFSAPGLDSALKKAQNLDGVVGGLAGKVVTTTIRTIQETIAKHTNANGGIIANGVRAFADGGIQGRLPSTARIQSPRAHLVQWAEPETHGEAFIPLAPSKRARSLQIWEETGRRLGRFAVTAFADGAVASSVTSGSVALGSGSRRLLSDADVQAIADAVRSGAAEGTFSGLSGSGSMVRQAARVL